MASLKSFYQFHLSQEGDRISSAFAVFFRATQKTVPRSLAAEPTGIETVEVKDVHHATWMGLGSAIHHTGGFACLLVLFAKVLDARLLDYLFMCFVCLFACLSVYSLFTFLLVLFAC